MGALMSGAIFKFPICWHWVPNGIGLGIIECDVHSMTMSNFLLATGRLNLTVK
jgi:hypothetical protein